MPSKKQNDQFIDAVEPALKSLLSDLEKTTEILRRAGKKGVDDKWDSNTSSTYQSYRKSGSYADGADPYASQHEHYSASNKSGPEYGSRYSSNTELQGGGRNSQRVDSLISQSDKSDYQTIPKGNCALCGDAIVGEVIIALGNMWHPEHFNCCHCNDEIGHKNFFERSGKAYCEADYHDLFSPRCSYCNGPIKERCVTAMGKNYHPEHFTCAECGKEFGEDGFHEKDGHALCKEDFFRLYAPKCKGCQQGITSKFITALGTHWHPECFACDVCGMSVGGSFFDNHGIPLCERHYHQKHGSLCAQCQEPISGRCVSAMARKFHPEHFTCAYCSRQLSSGTYRDCRGRPYCHSCYDRVR